MFVLEKCSLQSHSRRSSICILNESFYLCSRALGDWWKDCHHCHMNTNQCWCLYCTWRSWLWSLFELRNPVRTYCNILKSFKDLKVKLCFFIPKSCVCSPRLHERSIKGTLKNKSFVIYDVWWQIFCTNTHMQILTVSSRLYCTWDLIYLMSVLTHQERLQQVLPLRERTVECSDSQCVPQAGPRPLHNYVGKCLISPRFTKSSLPSTVAHNVSCQNVPLCRRRHHCTLFCK